MFFGVTLVEPVIFVAIVIDLRSTLRDFIHLPIVVSVCPSGEPKPEGIGYCSAVSIVLTPAPYAMSSKSKQAASSGALKSVLTHLCVPRAMEEHRMSEEPSERWGKGAEEDEEGSGGGDEGGASSASDLNGLLQEEKKDPNPADALKSARRLFDG